MVSFVIFMSVVGLCYVRLSKEGGGSSIISCQCRGCVMVGLNKVMDSIVIQFLCPGCVMIGFRNGWLSSLFLICQGLE